MLFSLDFAWKRTDLLTLKGNNYYKKGTILESSQKWSMELIAYNSTLYLQGFFFVCLGFLLLFFVGGGRGG